MLLKYFLSVVEFLLLKNAFTEITQPCHHYLHYIQDPGIISWIAPTIVHWLLLWHHPTSNYLLKPKILSSSFGPTVRALLAVERSVFYWRLQGQTHQRWSPRTLHGHLQWRQSWTTCCCHCCCHCWWQLNIQGGWFAQCVYLAVHGTFGWTHHQNPVWSGAQHSGWSEGIDNAKIGLVKAKALTK